ncbi:uncharacterized protein LOC143425410 [Xylocopa sonorina]|uniref:uncharacterized protein LOC143425410 n=1 Tax=Xylocopa sonorina TaxID=1818115 RepID=UPI00403B3356
MHREKDCRAYAKWKEERAKKSKKRRKVKKKERKEPTADCIDEDEIEDGTKPTLKINYRKCKKKKKKRRKRIPGRLIRKIYKRVSFAELVLNCIKPSIKEREYLLNQRHADCIGLSVPMIVIEQQTTKLSQIYPADRQKSDKKVIPCVKDKKRRRRKKPSRKKLEEQEPEDSECESICSFDSEVCLEGVKLTTKDNEEIRKYQREAREAIVTEETDET